MSTGHVRLDYADAYRLAEQAAKELQPKLRKLKAVGSLRRKERTVGDVEFVALPYFERDLSGELADPVLDPVRLVMREIGTWKKGADRQMVVTDLFGHEGVKLELFLVHPPAAWGSTLAIRTGPIELNRLVMLRFRERGVRHIGGHARRIGTEHVIPTDTEAEYFALAGLDCLPPRERQGQADALIRAQQKRIRG